MLQDDDLRLRPVNLPDDIALALPWYRDAEVLRFSEGEGTEPYGAETVEAMYRYLASHGELYIIEVRTPDGWRPVGDVTLAPDTLPIVIGEAAYRSRGLGKRVVALLIARARMREQARHSPHHPPSRSRDIRTGSFPKAMKVCGDRRCIWCVRTGPPNGSDIWRTLQS